MTNGSPWDRWAIEIDGQNLGLPFLKMGGSFRGYVTNNQMVVFLGWLVYALVITLW